MRRTVSATGNWHNCCQQANALIEGRLDYHEGMESPSEFTTRAARLLNDAVALSKNRSGDKTELNHWMGSSQTPAPYVGGWASVLNRENAEHSRQLGGN